MSDSTLNAAAGAAAQQQMLQRQLHLMQQQSGGLQSASAAAISRFPSNIDAHLRAPGTRAVAPPSTVGGPAAPEQGKPASSAQGSGGPANAAAAAAAAAALAARTPEMEMALQDALKVCNPDIRRPFESVEDAVNRLLPYHVVADYEAEEDDRILDNDTTGQILSRLQQWDHNILVKIAEFTTTFDKQVLAFNIMTRKKALGEFRSEERLMLEQALLMEEKQAMIEARTEIESREKAGREAAEAKMRMAMEAQAHAEMIARGPIKASAAASQGVDGSSHDMHQDQGNMEDLHGWDNAQREDEDASEDFLNDENDPENGDSGVQDEWRGSGELDLNTR